MELGSLLMALFTGLVAKVAVMIVTTWLFIYMWRMIKGKKSQAILLPVDIKEIKLLSLGVLFFWFSEMACAVESYILLEASTVFSILHSFTTATGMGLFFLAIVIILDNKVIHMFNPKKTCVGIHICKTCTFIKDNHCHFESLYKLFLLLFLFISIPVLFAPVETKYVPVDRYVLPFTELNDYYANTIIPWIKTIYTNYQPTDKSFKLHGLQLFVDYRIFPIMTIILSLLSALLLRMKRKKLSFGLFFFNMGLVAFIYFQYILHFDDILFGSLMHEFLELWFLFITYVLLKRIYLDPKAHPEHPVKLDCGQPLD